MKTLLLENLPRPESVYSLITTALSGVERFVKETVEGSKVTEDVVEVVARERHLVMR